MTKLKRSKSPLRRKKSRKTSRKRNKSNKIKRSRKSNKKFSISPHKWKKSKEKKKKSIRKKKISDEELIDIFMKTSLQENLKELEELEKQMKELQIEESKIKPTRLEDLAIFQQYLSLPKGEDEDKEIKDARRLKYEKMEKKRLELINKRNQLERELKKEKQLLKNIERITLN